MGLKSEVVVWYFGMRTMINNFYLFLLILEKICTCFPLPKEENTVHLKLQTLFKLSFYLKKWDLKDSNFTIS